MTTVGVLGTNGSVLLSENGPDAAMEKVGRNTGNLMFQYACVKTLVNPQIAFTLEESTNLDELREKIDVLLIPAANQLNPAWDLQWWSNMIEVLDKPVIVVGLGSQAKIGETRNIELQPGTQRFLALIGERAAYIGVRGQSTLEVLERYGVDNGIITGCPSNFINASITGGSIAQKISRIAEQGARRTNFLYGTLEEGTREVETRLFRLAGVSGSRLIRQTDVRILRFILDGTESAQDRAYIDWEARVLAPELTTQEYRRKLRHRGRYYFSAPSWIDEVSQDDLSIGQRIHGAVAAIQGGSLGVCVTFDSRTLELAQTMGYPHVYASDLERVDDLQELAGVIRFSSEEFDTKREALRKNLKQAFEHHGVETRL